ncbi:MAG: site-specific integrase [Halothiobacillaceae bacterium]|nr:site-specific integrase [Halothiobacillaceae bacterium]
MKNQTHLVKRGSTYYFRCRIPADLLGHYGKAEIKQSLKTKDPATAKRLARQMAVELDREFEQLRLLRKSKDHIQRLDRLDDARIQALSDLYLRSCLETDDWLRSHGLSDPEYDQRLGELEASLTALREAYARGRIETIQPAMDTFLMLHGIELDLPEDDLRKLALAFLKVATRQTELTLRRFKGEIIETDAVVQPPAPAAQQVAGIKPDTIFTAWQDDVPNRPEKTVKDHRQVWDDFVTHLGGKALDSLKRTDLIVYRKTLEASGLHFATVGKKLGQLHAIFAVAVDHELLEHNPASRVQVKAPKVKPVSRLPYDMADLQSIFACPLYAQRQRPKAGGGEAAAWLPLLALYTGARVEELAQLELADIRNAEGIDHIAIHDDGSRSLKTESSRRLVPLHPKLIEAGFLRYVQRLRQDGQKRLFPMLQADSKGDYSGNWSKWWGRYARESIGITDKKKVFHSFRHSFKDACRNAEIPKEVHDRLTGHKGDASDVGAQYGTGPNLKTLHQAIQRIRFEGLPLPMIEP